MTNRSVPANTLLPHIVYRDTAAAMKWLNATFGFVEHYRYGAPDAPSGVQASLGDAWIMLKQARDGYASPATAGVQTQTLTIFVEDVDAHYARTQTAEAKIVEELHETGYGERQYGVLDLEQHHWLFSRHAQDVNPSDWGAIVANPR